VEYYRYIRFFPDGHVLFLTCSDEPSTTVPGLREKQPKNPATLRGKYQLYGNNIVTAMVKNVPPPTSAFSRSNRRQQDQIQQSTSFHVEFEICPHKGRNNGMLKWAHHAAFTTKTVTNPSGRSAANRQNQNNSNSSVTSTTFDITPTKYPHMYFSRVKSYTTRSENILE
jgi:F-box protein 9